MTYMVTLKLDEADKARKLAASGAKVQIGKAGKLVSQDAVQIHGGMGMTDELNVGHFFKRVTMIESQFGNTDWHLRRYTGSQQRLISHRPIPSSPERARKAGEVDRAARRWGRVPSDSPPLTRAHPRLRR